MSRSDAKPPPRPEKPPPLPPQPPPLPSASPPNASQGRQAAVPVPRDPLPAQNDSAERPASPEPTQGYQADPTRRTTVYQLAAALVVAALFSTIPAFMDVMDHLQTVRSAGVSPWALLVLLASCLQVAYALYMAQMPDWSTVWVASVVNLLLATLYAMLLGVLLLADQHSQFIRLVGLADQLHAHRAASWCVIMLSLSCLLAYGMGRFSVRWHRTYALTLAGRVDAGRRCGYRAE